jgi:hypothetical protein
VTLGLNPVAGAKFLSTRFVEPAPPAYTAAD